MALRAGAILKQRYHIIGRLGRGGFGAVYLATDEKGGECAIKENLVVDPAANRQFEREARLLGELSHTNLPKVIEYFYIVGRGQYLVMEYIPGEDLADRLEKRGPLPEKELLPWIGQIASALSYLHERQPPVIHRDIKPANIRLADNGERAMLVDFGLAKVYDPGQRTTIGARAITPGYSPPEQYGQTTTDARSDIYALGATMYHLLTGREPAESTMRLMRDTLVPARVANPAVSRQVSDAIERAMALDPAQRFHSVKAFADALGIAPPRNRPLPAIATGGLSKPTTASPANVTEVRPAAGVAAGAPPPGAANEKSVSPAGATRQRRAGRPRQAGKAHWAYIGVTIAVLAAMLCALLIVQSRWMGAQDATPSAAALVATTVTPLPSATATVAPSPTLTPAPTETPTALPSPTATPSPPASPTPDPTVVSIIAATDTAAAAQTAALAAAAGLNNASSPASPRSIVLDESGAGELYQGYEHRDFQLIMVFEQLQRDYVEWTAGAILRYDLPVRAGDRSEALVGLAFNLSSSGEWRLSLPDTSSQGGPLGFDPSATEALTVEIVGQGDDGWLFVNNRFVAELDLSAGPDNGTLWLFADVPGAAGDAVNLLLTFRS